MEKVTIDYTKRALKNGAIVLAKAYQKCKRGCWNFSIILEKDKEGLQINFHKSYYNITSHGFISTPTFRIEEKPTMDRVLNAGWKLYEKYDSMLKNHLLDETLKDIEQKFKNVEDDKNGKKK
jgi:hypothetical protein